VELLHKACAGLDVHKDNVVACTRRVVDGKGAEHEVRTFGTTTSELLKLSQWLSDQGVTHVVMESTGVYWKPVWHILDDGDFALTLANAKHVKNVPGRKSDVNDAQWLADLLAHGLIRGSFVPAAEVQQLRDLTRSRKQLVREVSQHVMRVQKVLEDANIKLSSVVTDIMGKSGRAMLAALIDGETDPEKLAALARANVKKSSAEIREALRGRVSEHHRFMLQQHLKLIDTLNETIAGIDARIGGALDPFRQAAERLQTIPGISDVAANVIVAEVGIDMGRFPSAAHLVSWAGLCPRMDESAGKHRSTRIREGSPWLKTVLVQCAFAASRKKDSYLRAQYLRLKSRRGVKKAAVAVAASILRAVYFMLRDATEYKDLGPDHFDKADKQKLTARLVKRLESLGLSVSVTSKAWEEFGAVAG
jgi:transposase